MFLGDMVAAVTSAFGVKPCPPCKARQEALNRWHAQMTGQLPPSPPAQPMQSFVIETRDGQLVRRR